jgi:transposase-like protein
VPQTLNDWGKKAEVERVQRTGTTTSDTQHIKELERKVMELRRANGILKTASAFFAQAERDRKLKSRRPTSTVTTRITGSSPSAGCCR